MEVLEIKPVKNKDIMVNLINLSNMKSDSKTIRDLIEFFKYADIDFATIDVENDNIKNFTQSSLSRLLNHEKIPYFTVDIPEYAMGYIVEEILEKEDQVNKLIEEYVSMKDKDTFKGQNLKSWISVLKDEIEEKKNILQMKLRPQWIVKKILDIIKSKNKKEINVIHFAQDTIFIETMNLLKDLNVKIKNYEQEKEMLAFSIIINKEGVQQWKC